jgi:hypothetical protein
LIVEVNKNVFETFFGPKTCVAETTQALKIDQLGQIFMLSVFKLGLGLK